MVERLAGPRRLVENILPWFVLAILLIYTYARIVLVPYAGFQSEPSKGQIGQVFVQAAPGADLQVGDQLLQIGPVSFEDYKKDLRLTLFDGVQPKQVVPIVVLRDGQKLTISWVFPGFHWEELRSRLINIWWLAYFFWFFGTITWLLVRPRDERQWLLTLFYHLTAIWLMAGSLSSFHIWESAIVMRVVVWICLPVYWHLHWIFPRPLGRLPKPVLSILYLSGIVLGIAEWFQILGRNIYFLGFLLAAAGSVILLVAHVIAQPGQRREISLLATMVGIVILPPIAVSIVGLFDKLPWFNGIAMLSLYGLPGAYFYIVYRRQLGGLELRTNRAIIMIAYSILLFVVSVFGIFLLRRWFDDPGQSIVAGAVLFLVAGLGSTILFPGFQRWAEHHLLGVSLPPIHLVEIYTARITTALDQERLVSLLRDQVLPSLLIRQAALLRLDETQAPIPVFTLGVEAIQMPASSDIPILLAQTGQYRQPAGNLLCPWVRLALSLMVDGKPAGLCLLGRRDPDDDYAPTEIPTLQALMNQTALALVNIEQAGRLRAFYRADIESEETQNKRLALALHDDVLGQMALLSMSAGDGKTSPQFEMAYRSAVDHIREIINTLRLAMLNYGLKAAIDELADETLQLAGDQVAIRVDLPPSEVSYSPDVELHLFRIVQQACHNALKHAQASDIFISGRLDPGQIKLSVEDNGVGFAAGESLDLVELLARKHYGLVGMHERAALVGAQLQITSAPHQGTKVRVTWSKI
jgi:signal transduction histidine kinase